MIYESPYPTPFYPEQSLYEYLLGDIDFQDSTVVVKELEGKGRQLTLGELKHQAQAFGLSLLEKHDLKAGDVVMLNAPNSVDWAIVFMATQFVGLKTALANPAYIAKELAHVVSLTEPKIILTTESQSSNFKAASISSGKLVFIDTIPDFLTSSAKSKAKSAQSFKPSNLHETAYIPFSSGTTGLPKGVEITHANSVAMCQTCVSVPDTFFKGQKLLNFLPLYHAYALLCSLLVPVKIKGTTYLMAFDPQKFCKAVSKHRIQIAPLVPPVVVGLSKHPDATKENFKSLKFINCGASPLDAGTSDAFTKKTGVEVRQGFGMTETTVGAIGLHGNQKPGSIGKLLPGVQARLIDVDGKDSKKGERGELWIKARNVCKGYYRNEKATKETITEDGWLKTGDVALEDGGSFKIIDRVKELIKYSGFQIAPAELEGILNSNPKVAVSAVIGIYLESRGTEVPRAYIQLAPGVKDSKDALTKELSDYLAERVSQAKKLRGGVRFLDVVPISPSGKVLRKEMRALVERERESKL